MVTDEEFITNVNRVNTRVKFTQAQTDSVNIALSEAKYEDAMRLLNFLMDDVHYPSQNIILNLLFKAVAGQIPLDQTHELCRIFRRMIRLHGTYAFHEAWKCHGRSEERFPQMIKKLMKSWVNSSGWMKTVYEEIFLFLSELIEEEGKLWAQDKSRPMLGNMFGKSTAGSLPQGMKEILSELSHIFDLAEKQGSSVRLLIPSIAKLLCSLFLLASSAFMDVVVFGQQCIQYLKILDPRVFMTLLRHMKNRQFASLLASALLDVTLTYPKHVKHYHQKGPSVQKILDAQLKARISETDFPDFHEYLCLISITLSHPDWNVTEIVKSQIVTEIRAKERELSTYFDAISMKNEIIPAIEHFASSLT